MRTPHRISLPAHGLLELVAGIALTLAALALDLGGGLGTLATFAAGVTLAGIGLGAVQAMPLAVHQAIDRSLVVLLAAAAVGCALAGSAAAAVILLATAVGVLALEASTRWTRSLG